MVTICSKGKTHYLVVFCETGTNVGLIGKLIFSILSVVAGHGSNATREKKLVRLVNLCYQRPSI